MRTVFGIRLPAGVIALVGVGLIGYSVGMERPTAAIAGVIVLAIAGFRLVLGRP